MDRSSLEQLLAQGLSLAEIGRRFGMHESTVSYWAYKHGLQAAHRHKHAAKGAPCRDELAALVQSGLSTVEIAQALGRGKTSVRHWLNEFGLQTQWSSRREASKEGQRSMMLHCGRHGLTRFRLRAQGG
jgi:transposase